MRNNGKPRHSHLSRGSFWLLVALLGVAVASLVPIAQWKAERRRTRANQGQTPQAGSSSSLSPSKDYRIKQWHFVDGMPERLAQFETVFWEPDDSSTLRDLLNDRVQIDGKSVLEVGCGTGLISIHCLQNGASSVVATDVNRAAVSNTEYNADRLGVGSKLNCRLVSPTDLSAFSVVKPLEKFDLIISNPPWEDAPVQEAAAYALYDPGFQLLESFLASAHLHLKPEAQLLLAYGGKTAIKKILEQAPEKGWHVEPLDERDLSELPEVFVPAMVLRLTRKAD